MSNKAAETRPSAVSSSRDNRTTQPPSETKPSDDKVDSYKPADRQAPRYVRIPKINVSSRVLTLGVDEKGRMQAPNNIHDAGWYEQSARPGSGGAVLLDGHVSGKINSAVFKNLKTLVPGDEIEIERGDGQKFKYKVVTSKDYPVDQLDMVKALISVQPGVNGLNIITCSGDFNASNQSFNQRLLVQAVQV